MLKVKLNEIMLNNNIPFSVVANLDDNNMENIGNKTELEYFSLVENLFGNIEHIHALNESLKGQIMPQSWKQGNVKCLVCKPVDNVIVGLFYNEERTAIESYRFGKTLNDIIKGAWEIYK